MSGAGLGAPPGPLLPAPLALPAAAARFVGAGRGLDLVGCYDDRPTAGRLRVAVAGLALARPAGVGAIRHAAVYDVDTLLKMLDEAGFDARQAKFRQPAADYYPGTKQILRECLEMDYGGSSLVVDAWPRVI